MAVSRKLLAERELSWQNQKIEQGFFEKWCTLIKIIRFLSSSLRVFSRFKFKMQKPDRSCMATVRRTIILLLFQDAKKNPC